MCALSQKTVVLVTHQVEFLSAVDHILVIRITFDSLILVLLNSFHYPNI